MLTTVKVLPGCVVGNSKILLVYIIFLLVLYLNIKQCHQTNKLFFYVNLYQKLENPFTK